MNEVLNAFETRFGVGLAQGKTEDETAVRPGDPRGIAENQRRALMRRASLSPAEISQTRSEARAARPLPNAGGLQEAIPASSVCSLFIRRSRGDTRFESAPEKEILMEVRPKGASDTEVPLDEENRTLRVVLGSSAFGLFRPVAARAIFALPFPPHGNGQ